MASVFPAASVALTWNVCEPCARFEYVVGLAHATNEPESSLHWNVEPDSVEENANVAVLALLLPEGPLVMLVSGATVSTVQLNEAGVGSVLPVESVAFTWKVCDPCARPVYVLGLVQEANDPLSSLHWNVAVSVAVKLKVADVEFDAAGGDAVMLVSGIVSIVQVRVTAEPAFPAGSVADTENVWLPCASPL